MAHDLLGRAADKKSFHAGTALGGEHDQVDVESARGGKNLDVGTAHLHEILAALGSGNECAGHFLEAAEHGLGDRAGNRWGTAGLRRRVVIGMDHVQEHDLRGKFLRERHGVAQRLTRLAGKIEWDEYGAEARIGGLDAPHDVRGEGFFVFGLGGGW